jgi:branched-chain amino acid transport system permease protein
VPAPALGALVLDTEKRFYYLTLAIVIIAVTFARNLVRSRVGRAFVAIRDRDLAAEIMGISLFRYKLTAFAISSFYAGVAGALWVSFMRIVTPDHFPFHLSIQYLAMVIVGGMGSVIGSILGAIFMVLTPEVLNVMSASLSKMVPAMGQLFIPMKEVVFGGLIVLFLIFEPLGLAEIWRRVKAFFLLWPFSY